MTQLSLARHALQLLCCEDAMTWLSWLPDETADLVVTDTAYESLEKHRARGTTTRLKQSKSSSNKWFPIFHNAKFPALFREFYRVLKPNTHCYFLCDEETMWVARPAGEAAGFKYWKSLIWVKTSQEGKPNPGMGYHWRNTTERIMFFEKGKRALNQRGPGDVIEEPALAEPWSDDVIRAPRIRAGYPTEKPPALLRPLIENSSAPGELVLDPFMGSGSTGFAALSCGRRFGGCDIDAEAFELTKARLDSVPAQISK